MTTNGTEERPLPDGWEWTQLGQVCTVNGGYAFKSRDYQEKGIPLLRISNINDKDVTFDEKTVYLNEAFASEHSDFLLNSGDIVIALSGATTGKYGVFNYPGQALLNQRIGRLKFNDSSTITSKYIFYYMEVIRKDILEEAYGAAQPNISTRKLAEFDVPFAPLLEQERIVAEIEKQFTRLDQAVASLKRLQSNLARYKASVLKAACEGRLVPQDPNDEPAAELLTRILAERRAQWEAAEWQKLIVKAQKKAAQAQRKAQGLPSRAKDLQPGEWEAIAEAAYARYLPKGDKWKEKYKEPAGVETAVLPDLPEGWVWVRVEQLSKLIQYGTSDKASAENTGIPVLRMGNIQDGQLDFGNLKYMPEDWDGIGKLLLEEGDVIFNRTNSAELVGKTAVYKKHHPKSTFASYLIRVQLASDVLPDFLSFYINSVFGRMYIGSVVSQQVGQANVNGTKLANMPLPLPPLAEQKRIVAEVERRLSVVAITEQAITTNLARAERLRQSILGRAFTGQLV